MFKGPLEIVRLLNRHEVSFVLIGLHGICGWMDEPRCHPDVDILVSRKDFIRAQAVIRRSFKNLVTNGEDLQARFSDRKTGAAILDLFRSEGWYQRTFKNTHCLRYQGQSFRIPSLEMALAMRFRGLIDRSRPQEDRYMDAHDFLVAVKANPELDLNKLAELCDSAWHNGGYRVLWMVKKYRAGRKVFPLEKLLS
jgi:hypothetical protein